ncbi:hypothetical protein F53441_1894 [Fusarium austroafricanum]|uniref:3CxxC-type domain-containing protein n=1 Tax=Fusarium austroafricanum TaxID=2364996 RepID=A0A8H4KTC0_9HYPO|nr:hypothetical protein F53441_1894 [Fusarium austroafricanum]
MPRINSWRWSMYPQLHRKVSPLLSKDNLRFRFHNVDDDSTCIKSYDTNVMGRFVCNNRKCANNGWSSKKIAITIRMYDNERYNARVYNQHCKACNSASRPFLDEKSYADRVAYRIKKWSGIKLDPPHYSGEFTGEHEKDLFTHWLDHLPFEQSTPDISKANRARALKRRQSLKLSEPRKRRYPVSPPRSRDENSQNSTSSEILPSTPGKKRAHGDDTNPDNEQIPRPETISTSTSRNPLDNPPDLGLRSNASSFASRSDASVSRDSKRSKRSQSPTKLFPIYGPEGQRLIRDTLSTTAPRQSLPSSLSELIQDINDISRGFSIIPQSMKAALDQHLKNTAPLDRLHDFMFFEDTNSIKDLDESLDGASAREVLRRALRIADRSGQCSQLLSDESAWNNMVHTPLLELFARDMYSCTNQELLDFISCTTTNVDSAYHRFPDTASRVDYVLRFIPERDPTFHAPSDVMAPCFNWTSDKLLQQYPLAFSIETKRYDVGVSNIQDWLSGYKSQAITTVLCSIEFGNTSSVIGVLQVIAGLRRLRKWSLEILWPCPETTRSDRVTTEDEVKRFAELVELGTAGLPTTDPTLGIIHRSMIVGGNHHTRRPRPSQRPEYPISPLDLGSRRWVTHGETAKSEAIARRRALAARQSYYERRAVEHPNSWQYPPEFWDRLSKVPLIHSALEELDRRTLTRPSCPPPLTGLAQDLTPTAPSELARFARHGGPDLQDLRGYPPATSNHQPAGAMSPSSRSRATESTNPTTPGTTTTKRSTTPYNRGFEQHLTDHGVHPIYSSIEPDLEEAMAAIAVPSTLKLFAYHIAAPTTEGGQPEYHMTKIRGFDMTDTRETFVQGATAFRNIRDLAKRHRDDFIQAANARAAQVAAAAAAQGDLSPTSDELHESVDRSDYIALQDADDALQQHITDASNYALEDDSEATTIPHYLYAEDDSQEPSQAFEAAAFDDPSFASSFMSSFSTAKRPRQSLSPPSSSRGNQSSKSRKPPNTARRTAESSTSTTESVQPSASEFRWVETYERNGKVYFGNAEGKEVKTEIKDWMEETAADGTPCFYWQNPKKRRRRDVNAITYDHGCPGFPHRRDSTPQPSHNSDLSKTRVLVARLGDGRDPEIARVASQQVLPGEEDSPTL